ncbi:MAG: hypothetical protein KC609_19575 [Myxococcales bacterium]|nr:hypothetical protein [Myxococcales bacterium]
MKSFRTARWPSAIPLLALVALAWLQACAVKFQSDACSTDDDCFLDEICTSGTCQSLEELQGNDLLGGDPSVTPASLMENPDKGLSASLRFRVDGATPRGTFDFGFCTNVALHREEADGQQICDGGFLVRFWVNDDGQTFDVTIYRHQVGTDWLTDEKTLTLDLRTIYTIRLQHDNRSFYARVLDEAGTMIDDWQSSSDTLTQYNEIVLINWTEADFGKPESWITLTMQQLIVQRGPQVIMNESFAGKLTTDGPTAWCVVMPGSMMVPQTEAMQLTFSTLTQQVLYACISDRCPPDTLECSRYHAKPPAP